MTETVSMSHMTFIEEVTRLDILELRRKEETYQGSWKRRGGVGAFMVTARKWDRLEEIIKRSSSIAYDIFAHIAASPDGSDGTALAEIRDLRRYLILVEAEMISRNVVKIEGYQRRRIKEPLPQEDKDAKEEPVWDGSDCVSHEDKVPSFMIKDPRKDGLTYLIVDRRKIRVRRPELFSIELNDKEHELMPACFRGLYEWVGSDDKWIMRLDFRRDWSKNGSR